jgi:hypothetical protein
VLVREGPKTLVAACVALVLAAGLVACGGSDNSDSTSTKVDSQSQASAPDVDTPQDSGKGKSGSASQGKADSDTSSAPEASDFVPKQHSDSGGGSEQFKVKGGDNSIQEFGAEADESEFEEAATALHNFLDARAEGNWAATCNYMSKSVIESFEKLVSQSKEPADMSCSEILGKLVNPAAKALIEAEAEKADVRSLRTEGEQAFLIYTGTEGTILAMPMANEDGEWKVASLAGTPLN